METNKEKNVVDTSIIKHFTKVLIPGDDVTIKFNCPKFAFLEVVIREIPDMKDDSIFIKHE